MLEKTQSISSSAPLTPRNLSFTRAGPLRPQKPPAGQETRAKSVEGTGGDNQYPHVINTANNDIDASGSELHGGCLEHRAPGAGDGGLDLAVVISGPGEDGAQTCEGHGLEDGTADGQADELTLALGYVQELDDFGDAFWLNQLGA